VSLFALVLATLTTNVAANVVAPANAFSNLAPRRLDFARGGVLNGVIGIAILPWRLLESYGTFSFGWLVGSSGFLGPVAAIRIADYWVVRRTRLEVDELFRRDGRYPRFNPAALVALGAGAGVALAGLVVPPLRPH
jgi:NCS1 family nucleobase:cation symporter-1